MADLDKMKANDNAAAEVPKCDKVFTFQKERTDNFSISSTMGKAKEHVGADKMIWHHHPRSLEPRRS
jgi:hypothetical protein